MKKLLLVGAALGMITAMTAAPAFAAGAATSTINLNANVAGACGLGHVKGGFTSDANWAQGDQTVVLADENGQFSGASLTNLSFGNIWCNNGGTMTFEVGAMKNAGTVFDTGSFTNRFDVAVTTDMGVYMGGGRNMAISTVGTGTGVQSVTGPNIGAAFETGLRNFGGVNTVQVLADPSGKRPIAGAYQGYIRVSVAPNV